MDYVIGLVGLAGIFAWWDVQRRGQAGARMTEHVFRHDSEIQALTKRFDKVEKDHREMTQMVAADRAQIPSRFHKRG